MVAVDPVYFEYWKRKRILAESIPRFPLLRWWPDKGLSEVERKIFESTQLAKKLLDVGAGNLAMRTKYQEAGYAGQYETTDIGTEFEYTHKDVFGIRGHYDAILFLDVVEHLELSAGLRLVWQLMSLLPVGGRLVLQTTNSRCIRSSASKDMTHLHSYNLPDLYAYFTTLGFDVQGYRVVFSAKKERPVGDFMRDALGRWVTARLLGCDYADNILIIAEKKRQNEALDSL